MTDRLFVLAAAAGIGLLLLGLFELYRRRWTDPPERLAVEDFGLELMEGCCAFIVFTSPSCRPCKAALKIVGDAAASNNGVTEVVAIDATEHHEVANRYEVRTIPTVFLITASGHVIKRWREVPELEDARSTLGSV